MWNHVIACDILFRLLKNLAKH
ncbi:unnamed protein product [Callosobruchus maculatus]|uniref:Uncharacterized protein n=1 Tax=Callosobruchus maculatus TaxID=64391 RepID=A0A653CU46_CALMS|nr:unnamed protein product [Callosobruchus maculatus]